MAQKRITKSYDQEFKSQAVKLAQEIGGHKAAAELGIPSGTIYAWIKAFKQRLMFIAIKTEDGRNKGKIAFYCKALGVTRQGFYHYLKTKDLPWKYQALADAMIDICAEDECNDTYGRIRMHQALQRQIKKQENQMI